MAVSSNLLLFIVGVGIMQGIFLACLIYFHPRSDRSVNAFLALYILCYCIPMFTPVVQHFYSWQLLLLIHPFLLLIGPFLYLYVCSFKERITWRKAWPHFILFFLFMVFDGGLYVTLGGRYPSSHQVPPELPHNPLIKVHVFIRMAQMIAYFFLAGSALTSYQHSIRHLFSETSRINLAWVRWLINGYLILLLIMIGLYTIILQRPDQFRLIILINTAIVTPYMYAITLRGIMQPTLWQLRQGWDKDYIVEEMQEAEKSGLPAGPLESKSPKGTVSQERMDDIVARTIALMEKEKLYLQSELTLQNLADKLNTPSYQVTQAINEGLKKNFYDLVNGYRVEEAKRLLMDPGSRTSKILTVGLDAGFNSKTTFNTVFKKFTGFTPSDFKEQQRKKEPLQV